MATTRPKVGKSHAVTPPDWPTISHLMNGNTTDQKRRDFRPVSNIRSCTLCCWASMKRFKSCYCKANKRCEKVFPGHQLSFVQKDRNAPVAAPDLPVGSRLHKFWEIWGALGASPKFIRVPREGYPLPSGSNQS